MILAHKIALDPTVRQRKAFAMAAGCARVSFNWGLDWWQGERLAGRKPTWMKAKLAFNQIKHQEFPWISLSPKDANQNAFEDLGDAFKRFFKKQNKFPKRKKRKNHAAFTVSNDKFRIEGSRIRLPKIGWVRMFEELRFQGKIMSATVSRTADRWFVAVQVEVNVAHVARTKQSVVGVDLGLKTAVVVSDGTVFDAPKPLKKNLRKLQTLQRQVSRKKKGSNRKRRAQMKVSRLHAQIARIRKDFLHKVTTDLVQRHTTICIEDLNVKGMMANHKLARAISDIGFYEFRRQLEYKTKLAGIELVFANRWFPSTQTCSCCGCIRENKLTLADRVFVCEDCGFQTDRDLNAAKNLATLGLRGSHARGQNVSPSALTAKATLVEPRTNLCSLVSTT